MNTSTNRNKPTTLRYCLQPSKPYLAWETMNPQPTIKQAHCSNNSVLIQHAQTTDERNTNRTHPAQTINTLLWDTYSACFILFFFCCISVNYFQCVYWQRFSYAVTTWQYQFCLYYLILKVKHDCTTGLYICVFWCLWKLFCSIPI